jgi:hypothetical protein
MTLEEVRMAFESWRANRVKRGPIPEALWSMVRELLPYYKKSRIAEALKMSGAQLESGCKKNYQHHKTTQSGFAVGYFSHQACAAIQPEQQRCELTLKGARKSLQISIDITQLARVFPLMEGCL